MVVILPLALVVLGAPPPWNAQRTEHLDQVSRLLKAHTALLTVDLKPKPAEPLAETTRTGYGVVLGPRLVATNYFVVEDGTGVTIDGPSKRSVKGTIVLSDVKRRVALIKTEADLSRAGLRPAEVLPKKDRKVDADVFALVSTIDLAGVMHGVITQTGGARELEGHPRTTLTLTLAMPVYDDHLRFVGFSRAVAWDHDKKMLIPPEMITAARTATGAAAREKAQQKDTRPWWGR